MMKGRSWKSAGMRPSFLSVISEARISSGDSLSSRLRTSICSISARDCAPLRTGRSMGSRRNSLVSRKTSAVASRTAAVFGLTEAAFAVLGESYCSYSAPARSDAEIVIRTQITELRRRSVRFGYEAIRADDGVIIAEGETGHVVTDMSGRVISMPESYRLALSSPPLAARGSDE